MNVNRYIVPATIAAALHTAFVLAFPGGPAPSRPIEIPLTAAPRVKPDDPVILTNEDAADPEVTVKALAQPQENPPAPPPPVHLDLQAIQQTVDRVTPEPTQPFIGDPGFGPPIPDAPSGPRAPHLFNATDLDRTPRAVSQIPPSYPYSMKNAGIAGLVLVDFVVDSSGQVTSAHVVHASQPEFEEPTIRAVLRWRFEPGTRNGRKVPFRMQVPVSFAVTDT